MEAINVAGRSVGPGCPALIIAEAGVNHNGDTDLALQLVDAALAAGADAVKFQMFRAGSIAVPDARRAPYQLTDGSASESQQEMLRSLELSDDEHARIKEYCERSGIVYLCTPYDAHSVEALDRLDVAAYKIASADITNLPLLRLVAERGRPVILSTGMSTLGEVEEARDLLASHNLVDRLILLHCTSEYPAPLEEVNLRAMDTLRAAFGVPVGFSDHTPGIGAGPWAVARGACVVEKHLTLDRALPGPDHKASLEPDEFRHYVNTIRQVEVALGDGVKRPMPSELPNRDAMRRSLTLCRDVKAGERIMRESLLCRRPGSGLPPRWLDIVEGKRAARDLKEGTILRLEDLLWSDDEWPSTARV